MAPALLSTATAAAAAAAAAAATAGPRLVARKAHKHKATMGSVLAYVFAGLFGFFVLFLLFDVVYLKKPRDRRWGAHLLVVLKGAGRVASWVLFFWILVPLYIRRDRKKWKSPAVQHRLAAARAARAAAAAAETAAAAEAAAVPAPTVVVVVVDSPPWTELAPQTAPPAYGEAGAPAPAYGEPGAPAPAALPDACAVDTPAQRPPAYADGSPPAAADRPAGPGAGRG